MGLKRLAEKVADYKARLESGQAREIKPAHVEKVLQKLHRKADALEADIAAAQREDKRERLRRKLAVAREHIARAQWLLNAVR